MSAESTVMRSIWLALSIRATLFRANSGKAWLSGGGPARVDPTGTAHVPRARPVALGLAMTNGNTVPGLPDLVGFTRVVITPEMVGRSVPVFTAIETKATGGGKRRTDQISFIERMHVVGAIAGFASSEAQASEIIDAWMESRPVSLL
jgi:hypothetical protein